MSLIESLEKRAKELDRDLVFNGYNAQKFDDRELLEQAAGAIRQTDEIYRRCAILPKTN